MTIVYIFLLCLYIIYRLKQCVIGVYNMDITEYPYYIMVMP